MSRSLDRCAAIVAAGLSFSTLGCGRGTANLFPDGGYGSDQDPVGDGASSAPDAATSLPDAARPESDAGRPGPDDDADASSRAPDAGAGAPDAGGEPGDDGDWVTATPPALGARPPMGWSSWNKFGCGVNEAIVRSAADAMVANGMRDAGYEYVNLDDCWQTTRTNGTIVADPNTFPSGIAALAAYVHERGLKFGIYSGRSMTTCAGRPASQGYEAADAATYASWGVDYVKYDGCNGSLDAETQFRTMQSAIGATGRPMLFGLRTTTFAEYLPSVAQSWRITENLADNWNGVMTVLDRAAFYGAYARPGGFNDPDMLQVGNGTMSEAEYRAHFSLWAMLAAPLIAGNDLPNMSPAVRDILTNEEVIAVDQDAFGYQGHRVQFDDGREVWMRPLAGAGQRAVLLFNRTGDTLDLTVPWTEIGLQAGSAQVRDLWQHRDRGAISDQITVSVPAHDVVMLKVSGKEPPPPTRNVFLSDLTWTYAANGWGRVERDRSVGDWYDADGRTLSVGGTAYAKGLGVHAGSLIRYRLGGHCTRFRADVGIDDEAGSSGSVVFKVLLDGEVRYQSTTITRGSKTPIDLPLLGARELKLLVTSTADGGENDHADWADARLECAPNPVD